MDRSALAQNKGENGLLDLLKLLLSVFVVYIHTDIKTGNSTVDMYFIQGVFRIAVPLFFFIAGYYLFSKMPCDKKLNKTTGQPALSYAKRIFKMYVMWSMIYLIYQIYTWLTTGVTIRDIGIYLEYAIVRGDSYLHLWYLSSLFTGVLLVWLFRKFFSIKITLLFSLSFFVVGLFLLPYYYVIRPVVESNFLLIFLYENFNRFIGWPRCGLFFGFVYVALGAFFVNKKIKINCWLCVLGIVVSSILSFVELTIIDRNWSWDSSTYGAMQLSHIPLVIFIFSLFNSFDNINVPYSRTIRKISTWVYLIHPAVIIVLDFITCIHSVMALPFVKGFAVFVCSFFISLLFVTIEKNKAFSFLKKLY